MIKQHGSEQGGPAASTKGTVQDLAGQLPQKLPVSVVPALRLCHRCLQVACVPLKEEMPPYCAAAMAVGVAGCDIRSD